MSGMPGPVPATGAVPGQYRDVSVSTGINAGFQFEFLCGRCQAPWRSRRDAFVRARAAGWLSQLGGLLRQDVAQEAQQALAGGEPAARAAAFERACEEARGHYVACPRCTRAVCPACWRGGACAVCAAHPMG